jgi:hypothetical protein
MSYALRRFTFLGLLGGGECVSPLVRELRMATNPGILLRSQTMALWCSRSCAMWLAADWRAKISVKVSSLATCLLKNSRYALACSIGAVARCAAISARLMWSFHVSRGSSSSADSLSVSGSGTVLFPSSRPLDREGKHGEGCSRKFNGRAITPSADRALSPTGALELVGVYFSTSSSLGPGSV